jgi:polysaccharide export outer membrane protein
VKSEYDIARLDMARAMARIARLEAQLAGKSDMPPVDLTALGLPKARIAQMLREEADILATTLTDYQRERDFLKTSVAQASDRITVVEKQQTQEEEGSRADSVELQRMIELLSKGQEINPRVVDARRALLLSSTRALQVNVQLLELKRQKAEGERSLQRLEDERRIAWLDQMQEATAARTTAAVKVHALEGEFGAAAKSQTGDPFVDLAKIDIEVFRQQGVHSVRSTVDDDFELAPGDTIEVTVTATDQAAQASPSQ